MNTSTKFAAVVATVVVLGHAAIGGFSAQQLQRTADVAMMPIVKAERIEVRPMQIVKADRIEVRAAQVVKAEKIVVVARKSATAV